MSKKAQAKRRDKLFELNPYCPFCGVLMILPKDLPSTPSGKIKKFPGNMCTLEHLRSRHDPLRPMGGQTIICCSDCNHKRGAAEDKVYGNRPVRKTNPRFPPGYAKKAIFPNPLVQNSIP